MFTYTFSRFGEIVLLICIHACIHMMKSSIYSVLTILSGPYQLLEQISGTLAAECSTIFTRYSLTVSVCCLVLSRFGTVGFTFFE